MNHDSSLAAAHDDIAVSDRRSPAWGAILAGAVAGLGTHLLLMMLLAAIGLAAASPATDQNPVATFGIGTAIAWTIAALASLFVGGWVAGRCAARVHSVSGAVHGFLVWCVGTIAALLLAGSGAGALVSGAARVVGEGASAMAKPVAGAANFAKEAAEQNTAAIGSMLDEVSENPQVRNAAGGVTAARREVGQAIRTLFREGGNLRDPAARQATLQALTAAGLSESDANRMLDQWTTSMERLRADAERTKAAAAAKAREVADQAAKALAKAALWTFIGFVLGAIAASAGGRRGQNWEYQHTEIGADATLDPAIRGGPAGRVPRHA